MILWDRQNHEDKKFVRRLDDARKNNLSYALDNTNFSPIIFKAFENFHDNGEYLKSFLVRKTSIDYPRDRYDDAYTANTYDIHTENYEYITKEMATNKDFVLEMLNLQHIRNKYEPSGNTNKIDFWGAFKQLPYEFFREKYPREYARILREAFHDIMTNDRVNIKDVYKLTTETNVFDQTLTDDECYKFIETFTDRYYDEHGDILRDPNGEYFSNGATVMNWFRKTENAKKLEPILQDIISKHKDDAWFIKKALVIFGNNDKDFDIIYKEALKDNTNIEFWGKMLETRDGRINVMPVPVKTFENLPKEMICDKNLIAKIQENHEELFKHLVRKYPDVYGKVVSDEIIKKIGSEKNEYLFGQYEKDFYTNEVFSDMNIKKYKDALLGYIQKKCQGIDVDENNIKKVEQTLDELEEYKETMFKKLDNLEKNRPDNKEKEMRERLERLSMDEEQEM